MKKIKRYPSKLRVVLFTLWFWLGLHFGLPLLLRNNLYLLSILNVFIGTLFGGGLLLFFLFINFFPRPKSIIILFSLFFIINIISSANSPYIVSDNFLRIFGLLGMNFGLALALWLSSKIFLATDYLAFAGQAFISGLVVTLFILILSNSAGWNNITVDQRFGDEGLLHPNSIGVATGVGLLFSLLLPLYKLQFLKIATILGLTFALLSTVSKTSIGGFLLAFSVGLLISRRQDKTRTFLLSVGITGICILVFGDFLTNQLYLYLQNQYVSSTFSGRTQIWNFVLLSIPQRPWFGFGFSVFKDAFEPTRLQLSYRVPIVHAHNAYMDVLFSSGYFGLGIFLLLIAKIYFLIWREAFLFSRKTLISPLVVAIGIFLFIRSFTEAALNMGFDLWVLLAIGFVLETLQHSRKLTILSN